MDYTPLLAALRASGLRRIWQNEPLAEHANWRIGGPADVLVEPSSRVQLRGALEAAARLAIPWVLIGHGTNLLFDDRGVRGLVIKIGGAMSGYRIRGTRIVARAGTWVPRLARAAAVAGLKGLEHAAGIPGTLGGLVAMNGGSQRQAIGDRVTRVWALDPGGVCHCLSQAECRFGYRSSRLATDGLAVAGVELCCERGDARAIRCQTLHILRQRRNKFPRKLPNCGSVFLSNGTMHARFGPPGRIIEQAGLKGTRVGNAQVSWQHANFIVNRGGARSAEVVALVRRVRQEVFLRTGLWMECEVRYVAPHGSVVPLHCADVGLPDASPASVCAGPRGVACA